MRPCYQVVCHNTPYLRRLEFFCNGHNELREYSVQDKDSDSCSNDLARCMLMIAKREGISSQEFYYTYGVTVYPLIGDRGTEYSFRPHPWLVLLAWKIRRVALVVLDSPVRFFLGTLSWILSKVLPQGQYLDEVENPKTPREQNGGSTTATEKESENG